jgi:uncharacterized protein (TIGR00369 family)
MDEHAARQAFEHAIGDYQQDFGSFFLLRLMDLKVAYPDDTCTITFPVRDFLFNPQGTLHGGVSATVLDIAMGHLMRHTYGSPGTTLEMKTQYFRGVAAGGEAKAEARILRRGREICFLEARLFDQEDRLAIMATSTWKLMKKS